ncbi:MAG: NAD(+) diphosphatase [Alphaproteobacteria bacterium]|nr:NAD(+) diphosphatase [Alphaproteobacteria bacterium]HPF46140.1 NAD(+) diphosphatase [Emcibacteraceae bacterium]
MFFENSCIFAEFPLDPCDHIRSNDDLLNELATSPNARFVVIRQGEALMDRESGHLPEYFSAGEIKSEMVFLGQDLEHSYFAIEISDCNCGQFLDLRTIARTASANGFSPVPSLLARAKMLLDWHQRHKFCANCGENTKSAKGGYVRICPACKTEHFPRVDPVVIMMIIYDDKCLLGRSKHFAPGMYSALAGFMEPGETIEEAVRREVMEEAHIRVGEVKYIKSQPWPFPSSLMIGTIGKALNNVIEVENDELEQAQWFDKNQIQNVLKTGGDDKFRVPDKLAIARHLLEYWLYHY